VKFKFIGQFSKKYNDQLNKHDYIHLKEFDDRDYKLYACNNCGLRVKFSEKYNSCYIMNLKKDYEYTLSLTCSEMILRNIL
jgi:hypothetical protein